MSAGEKVKVLHVDGSESWAVPREKHPAVFSDAILAEMADLLVLLDWPGSSVLDPFAGKGRVHSLPQLVRDECTARAIAQRRVKTVGVEIEPEWAACSAFGATLVGDSTNLPRSWTRRFGAVATSPCYGNRFADSHTPGDTCKRCKGTGQESPGDGTVPGLYPVCKLCKGSKLSPRRSYTHDLGHALMDNNAGAMHYGPAYRELHRAVWLEVARVMKPGGLFLLNVKDFIRDGRRVRVSEWHRRTVVNCGFVQESTVLIPQPGLRHGANRERIPNELIYVMRRAS